MLDDIKKTLWATADKLRANMDAAEYKHLVLGLIFVKYISDTGSAGDQGPTAGPTQWLRAHGTPTRIPVNIVRHHLVILTDFKRGAHLKHLGVSSPGECPHEQSRWIEVQLQVPMLEARRSEGMGMGWVHPGSG